MDAAGAGDGFRNRLNEALLLRVTAKGCGAAGRRIDRRGGVCTAEAKEAKFAKGCMEAGAKGWHE